MKRLVFLCLVPLSISFRVAAFEPFEPYRSYIFDFWGEPVPAPQAYQFAGVISGQDLGVGHFEEPSDLCVANDGSLYISDTVNNRLIRVKQNWSGAVVIDSFLNSGTPDTFHSPRGLYVSREGELYVSDMGAERILHFDENGDLVTVFNKPEPDFEGAIPADFIFKPLRIAVSPIGKLYVTAEGVYEGLLEYDLDGKFTGFIGAPRVAPNALDIFWRRFATREQRERLALFLPTEYNSMDLDSRGFIYVIEKNTIRRLNPTGENIFIPRSFTLPVGDVPVANHAIENPSLFIDIAVRGAGMFSILDLERGRIFTYDKVGNLLYVFGGIGLTKPLFQSPIAIEAIDDSLLILDLGLNRIFIFRPLPYADAIHAAVRSYESGLYDLAAENWRQVLSQNVNFDIAYSGIAGSQLQNGEFADAMRNYKLGNNREGYSEAFRLYRRDLMAGRFGLLVLIILSGIAAVYAFFRIKPVSGLLTLLNVIPKRGVENLYSDTFYAGRIQKAVGTTALGVLYSGHVVYHPFDGFWDIKFEKRGNMPAALTLVFVFCLVYIFSQQYTAFLFNFRDQRRINVFMEFINILAPFFVWCVVNWALSVLLEGKGTFKEIVITSGYSFTPLIIFLFFATIFSRFLSIEERAFLDLLVGIGIVWSLFLLFSGMLVIHEYTAARTVASIALTVVGIGVVIFIGLLFFSVINLLIGFISTVYGELVLRF